MMIKLFMNLKNILKDPKFYMSQQIRSLNTIGMGNGSLTMSEGITVRRSEPWNRGGTKTSKHRKRNATKRKSGGGRIT